MRTQSGTSLTISLLISISLIGSVCTVFAEETPENTGYSFTATIGAMNWSDLSDLDPAGSGDFNDTGFAIGMSVHRKIGHWGSADVLAGGDLGFFSTDSNIEGISDDYSQRGLYLTPSLKFRFGNPNALYYTVQLGAGWYEVDIAELDCDSFGCPEISEPFNADEFGGFIGIGAGLGNGLIIGIQAHFADFGEVSGLGTDAGELGGPFYMLNIGYAWGD